MWFTPKKVRLRQTRWSARFTNETLAMEFFSGVTEPLKQTSKDQRASRATASPVFVLGRPNSVFDLFQGESALVCVCVCALWGPR